MNVFCKTILFLFMVLILAGCNLNGPGIFLTISQSTEIDDSDLSTQGVKNILTVTGTNIMYIQQGETIKKADISLDAPVWTAVSYPVGTTASTNIFEAVVKSGNTLVYATGGTTENVKSVYIDSLTAPVGGTAVTGLTDVNLIGLYSDGTDVLAVISVYNSSNENYDVDIYTIDTTAKTSAVVGTGITGYDVPPSAAHFLPDDDSMIIVFFDVNDEDYINYYYDLAAPASSKIIEDPVFETDTGSGLYLPIIGTYYYPDNATYYLISSSGILITTADFSDSSYSALNSGDGEYMGLVLNAAGNTVSQFTLPVTVCNDGTSSYLVMGGINSIYYYDLAGGSIPAEFSSSDDFYTNISSSYITDLYTDDTSDFNFFTATAEKWVWETETRDAASSQLL